jgi:hypothetical protein
MRSYQKRLLSLSIVLVFAALFYNMSVCELAYAGKKDPGTTSGSGMDNWNDGGSSHDNGSHDDGSHDDGSSGHVKKPKKPHKHWFTSGNKYIDPENYFLGTTDAADLVIRTDNVERARITSEGNVGIGTDTPTGILHVEGGRAAGTTDDGTDITIKAQDGGIVSGAGGNIVLAPGSGILTDESGNPVISTDEFGNPILDEFGNPVPVTKNGEVIVKGNIAPASDDVNSVGTPDLRYKDIYLASNIHYQDDGLFFMFDFWNARDEAWVSLERGVFTWDGKFGIGIHEPTEELHVIGDVLATGNVDAASYTGDGSALTGNSATDITLQNNIDAEATARSDADTTLQNNIDNISITESQISNLTPHTVDTILDQAGVEGLGFVTGAHTVDTDTTRSDAEIVTAVDTAGYVSGPHASDGDIATMGYVKDQAGIEALVGAHTSDTTRSDAEIVAAVDTAGYVSGAHTTDTDTHIDQAGVKGLGFVTGTHTVDTDTQLDEAAVDAFVANNNFSIGAHTVDTTLDKGGVEALGISITESQIRDLVHTADTNTQLSEAEVDGFVANNNFSTGAHTADTTRSDAEIVAAVGTAGYVSGAHTTDTKLDKSGIEALVGPHTNAGLWDSNGTSVYYNDGFVGIGTGAAVPGAELEVRGNIIANIPTADNHLATKAYVDAASGGGGGCYVSYSGGCAAGFTSQGSAGTWGYCWNANSQTYRPPGASDCIHGGWNYTPKGAAYICCK